jgi:hypothetical protein
MKSELSTVLKKVREVILRARTTAVRSVDTIQVLTNFHIGRIIVEHEQGGKRRADYGKQLLNELSEKLISEFGKGFSRTNLEYFRRFYLEYKERFPQISQKPSGKSGSKSLIPQIPSGNFLQKPSAKSANPFTLSWSHYVFLLAIKDSDERRFYEIEATQGNWSLLELSTPRSLSRLFSYKPILTAACPGDIWRLCCFFPGVPRSCVSHQ